MTNQHKYFLILLIAVFASSCNGKSQTKSQIDKISDSKNLEKLATEKVEAIRYDDRDVSTNGFLDKSGNMWFTTLREGVFKYDGKTFKNFTIKDGLCSNKVNSVIEDNNGLLWFATSKGLCCYDGEVFIHFPLPQEHDPSVSPETSLPSRKTQEVLTLIQDRKGHFWLGTILSGAYQFDGKTFTSFLRYQGRIHPDDQVCNNCIQSIVEDETGNIWFGGRYGALWRYDGNQFKDFTYKKRNI